MALSANPMLLGRDTPLTDFDRVNRGIGIHHLRFISDFSGLLDAMAIPLETPTVSGIEPPYGGASPAWPRLMGIAHQGMRGVQSISRKVFDGRRIVASLRKSVRNSEMNEPTLVFANLMETHEPYADDSVESSRFIERGFIPSANYSYHSRVVSRYCSDTSSLRAAYAKAVSRADNRVMELFEALDRQQILDDSTFVILGDHGQCLGEHGFFGHSRYLYDELVRVPCVIWSKEYSLKRTTRATHLEFIDHRHVFRLVSGMIHGTTHPESFDRQLQESLSAIGPATSFFRGRPFRPNAILSRGPEYWLLRIVSSDRSVQGSSISPCQLRIEKTVDNAPDEFVSAWVDRAITSINRNSNVAVDDTSVLNRLGSWGYA